MSSVPIALIDDQPLFVEGFVGLCRGIHNIDLVATAGSVMDAQAIIKKFEPQIMFVEVQGIAPDIIANLARSAPSMKLVALTGVRSIAFAIQILEAGACGYVLKQSSTDELSLAMQALCRGEKFITHGFANKIVVALQDAAVRKNAARAIKLSIRENQIVRALLTGMTNKQIATNLQLSEKTVKHYMSLLMQKLNARNRLEVVIAARNLEEEPALEQVH